MSIIVGATVPPYKMSPGDGGTRWLDNSQALIDNAPEPVSFFAALEIDQRGLVPFRPLLDRLDDVASDWWTFHIDTGADEITGDERLARICAGRNLVREYAMREKADWILYLDSDMHAPDDAIAKMLELDYPVVGASVPVYVQDAPAVTSWTTLAGRTRIIAEYNYPVREQCPTDTAGLLLVHRSVFSQVAWRYASPLSDDPSFFADCALRGWPLLVRRDVIGDHDPLSPLEYRGHDVAIRRG